MEALKDGIQLVEMLFEGSISNQGNVINEANNVLHVCEKGCHLFLIDTRADGKAHQEALVKEHLPRVG